MPESRERARRRAILAAAAALALLAGAGASRAVTTNYWTVEGQEALLAGRPDGVAVTPEGRLELAPARHPVGESGQSWIWDLAPGERGWWYAATGGGGRVLALREGATPVTLFEAPAEESVFALESAGAGAIYAGTGPGGKLLRLRLAPPDGGGAPGALLEADTIASLDAEYIWDLLLSPAGDLYIAAGVPGSVHLLRKGSRAVEPWFRTGEEHVLSLAWHPDGALLAGTGNRGWAYRIEGKDRGRVIFDAGQREIRAIAVLRDGAVALAATGEPEKSAGEEAATATASPGAAVYRVSPGGTVERLWRSAEKSVHCLALFGEEELLVGTGEKGRVYRVGTRPASGAALLFAPEAGDVTALRVAGNTAALGLSQTGIVQRLERGLAASGTYESDVFDAGQISRWGAARWEGERAGDPGFILETRSGATAEPGGAWSGWEPLAGGAQGGTVASPAARYLQWRAKLALRDGRSPRVGRVQVAFLPPNLAPRIQRLAVSPLDARARETPGGSPPGQLHQKLPSGVEVQFSVNRGTPAERGLDAAWSRAYRTADWDVTDPNDDPLLYSLQLRPAGEREWTPLAEEIEGAAYTWNTASLPDGWYELRLRASDSPGNAGATALAAEYDSAPFLVDHTPPEIASLELRRESGTALLLSAAGRDQGSPLRGAWAALDGEDWVPLAAEDGILDEREETFRLQLEGGPAARHTVAVRLMDEAGNQAVRRATLP